MSLVQYIFHALNPALVGEDMIFASPSRGERTIEATSLAVTGHEQYQRSALVADLTARREIAVEGSGEVKGPFGHFASLWGLLG
jgi:hypothetical protein